MILYPERGKCHHSFLMLIHVRNRAYHSIHEAPVPTVLFFGACGDAHWFRVLRSSGIHISTNHIVSVFRRMEDESLFFMLLHHMDHGGIIFTVASVLGRLQGSLEKRIGTFNRSLAAASWSGRICFQMGCDDPVDPGRKKYPLPSVQSLCSCRSCS